MLVLSRFLNESIVIPELGITIVITDVKFAPGTRKERVKIKLGIDAPKHLKVHRKEIWEEIQQEGPNDGR